MITIQMTVLKSVSCLNVDLDESSIEGGIFNNEDDVLNRRKDVAVFHQSDGGHFHDLNGMDITFSISNSPISLF